MKTIMIVTTILTMVMTLPLPAFSAEEDACAKLDRMDIVGRSIRAHAKRIRGTHYCESRKSIEADIDGDGTRDLLVTYVIGGPCFNDKSSRPGTCGNYHLEYLAVFLRKNGRYHKPVIVQVGSRGERSVTEISAEGDAIHLKTLEYGDNDPMCCPSKPGKATYIFKKGNLSEEK